MSINLRGCLLSKKKEVIFFLKIKSITTGKEIVENTSWQLLQDYKYFIIAGVIVRKRASNISQFKENTQFRVSALLFKGTLALWKVGRRAKNGKWNLRGDFLYETTWTYFILNHTGSHRSISRSFGFSIFLPTNLVKFIWYGVAKFLTALLFSTAVWIF